MPTGKSETAQTNRLNDDDMSISVSLSSFSGIRRGRQPQESGMECGDLSCRRFSLSFSPSLVGGGEGKRKQ
jgi:hypothetical protein